MKIYYAPMEGITGHLHRRACQMFFPDIDKYFTPFIAANEKGKLGKKERDGISPENNEGIALTPQLLTNRADCFLATERTIRSYGYRELNLNLGCPSKTVTSRKRGSGFLAAPVELDHFLEEVFSHTECRISIKTRLGYRDREEFEQLLEIYNKYPLEELIVHPRTGSELYRGSPDWDAYAYAEAHSRNPLCYNGDIFDCRDYAAWKQRFPESGRIMLGRGMLMNPGLAGMLKGKSAPDKERIRAFHDEIYRSYRQELPGDRVVLFKMKELWQYLSRTFMEPKKYAKRIRKAERLPAYEDAVRDLFAEQELAVMANPE